MGDSRAALVKPAAIGIAALSVTLCAGALALLWLGPAHHPYGYDVSGDVVVGSLFPLAGALIAVREPGNRCSWVLLCAGLVALSAVSHEWAHDGLARPGSLPGVPVAVWQGSASGVLHAADLSADLQASRRASCSPARRNGGGSGATCTTGSAPSWPGWRCSSTAWPRPCGTRRTWPNARSGCATGYSTRSPRCAVSSRACGLARWTNSGSPKRCGNSRRPGPSPRCGWWWPTIIRCSVTAWR